MRGLRLLLVAAAAAVFLPPGSAGQAPLNPGFDVDNQAKVAIKRLDLRPEGTLSWGENKLGGRLLAPGQSATIREFTETNCKYRMRAIFQDGRTEEKPVDVCRYDRVVFSAQSR
jgi:hypothetical protein